jgi:hypothetical protein
VPRYPSPFILIANDNERFWGPQSQQFPNAAAKSKGTVILVVVVVNKRLDPRLHVVNVGSTSAN